MGEDFFSLRLLSRKEVAALLGISYAQVISLCQAGAIPEVRIGRRSLIRAADIAELIRVGAIPSPKTGRAGPDPLHGN